MVDLYIELKLLITMCVFSQYRSLAACMYHQVHYHAQFQVFTTYAHRRTDRHVAVQRGN